MACGQSVRTISIEVFVNVDDRCQCQFDTESLLILLEDAIENGLITLEQAIELHNLYSNN